MSVFNEEKNKNRTLILRLDIKNFDLKYVFLILFYTYQVLIIFRKLNKKSLITKSFKEQLELLKAKIK